MQSSILEVVVMDKDLVKDDFLWDSSLFEPFEDHLILTVEDGVGPNKDEVLGKVIVPLNSVERRADDRLVHSLLVQCSASWMIWNRRRKIRIKKFSTRLQLRMLPMGVPRT
ncbi:FT-interacting protein 7 [Camellia lanceoleosa]|nr:FT-interacting protein 7 [Camellia lanceoleosa]